MIYPHTQKKKLKHDISTHTCTHDIHDNFYNKFHTQIHINKIGLYLLQVGGAS